MGAGMDLPRPKPGQDTRVFISIKDDDKTEQMVKTAQILVGLGFALVATRGTAAFLSEHKINCDVVNKNV